MGFSLDLSAAFDTIDHHILSTQLQTVGISKSVLSILTWWAGFSGLWMQVTNLRV